VSVIKNEDVLKEYAKHFNADTSNGILFINTKEYVKNGKKEIVSVNVKAKEPAEEIDTDNDAFNVVEQMPQFPGGQVELLNFLSDNVKYPADAEKKKIEGRVIATFVVDKDGSITDAEIVRSVYPSLDAEALRVINAMPKWVPGKQSGKAVRVKYTVPLTFSLK
jgi:protein TonB